MSHGTGCIRRDNHLHKITLKNQPHMARHTTIPYPSSSIARTEKQNKLAAAHHIPGYHDFTTTNTITTTLPPLFIPHNGPTTSDSDKATLSSSTNHTAASQASTTSTRGPCKGILIGSDFALAFLPAPSPLIDEEEEEEDERFRFSNALCSARSRCLSATGARMMRAQSSASARSIPPCNAGAGTGEGEGDIISASADMDVDADADADPEADRDVDGESGSNKLDPGTVSIGATTGAGDDGGLGREGAGIGGASMASFPLHPRPWPFARARAREWGCTPMRQPPARRSSVSMNSTWAIERGGRKTG